MFESSSKNRKSWDRRQMIRQCIPDIRSNRWKWFRGGCVYVVCCCYIFVICCFISVIFQHFLLLYTYSDVFMPLMSLFCKMFCKSEFEDCTIFSLSGSKGHEIIFGVENKIIYINTDILWFVRHVMLLVMYVNGNRKFERKKGMMLEKKKEDSESWHAIIIINLTSMFFQD